MKIIQTIITGVLICGPFGVSAEDTLVEGVADLGHEIIDSGVRLAQIAEGITRVEPTPEGLRAEVKDPLVPAHSEDWKYERERGWFIGVGAGTSNVDLESSNRNEDGINFNVTADDDDLAGKFYLGYWINPNIGFEIAGVSLGNVTVPFNFNDPRNGRSGTGEAEVEISGFVASLLLGIDLHEKVHAFARAGANTWDRSLKSRFDVVGEDSVERTQDRDGTGLVYGAGLAYNFQAGWNLKGEAEVYDLDGDTVTVIGIGLSYDLGQPRDW